MNKKGFTLVEVMFVSVMFASMIAATSKALMVANRTWFSVDTKVQLQDNLRQSISRIEKEIRESGYDDSSVLQVSIVENAGINNSDIIRFSIPICVCSNKPMDTNGNVLYWGAPLAWGQRGCRDDVVLESNGKVKICHLPPGNTSNQQNLEVAVSALDAHLEHGDWLGACTECSVSNYKYIEYSLNNDNQLIRKILTDSLTAVKEEIFAENIADFQLSFNGSSRLITVSLTGNIINGQSGQISLARQTKIYLKNGG